MTITTIATTSQSVLAASIHTNAPSTAIPQPTPTGVYDAYADSIIGTAPERYDALEIHGVRDFAFGGINGETCCEVCDIHPQFFSVYVHIPEEGIECVGDFSSYKHAQEYAQELSKKYGWTIHDGIAQQLEAYATRTGIDVNASNLIDCIPLSTHKTVFRRLAENGTKIAFYLDRSSINDAEYDEYHRLLKRNKDELN